MACLTAERARFPLWVPVLFGAGAGVYFALPDEPMLWQALLPVFASLALSWRFRTRFHPRLFSLALLIASLGFLSVWAHTHAAGAPVLRNTLFFRAVEGRIDEKELREKGDRLTLSDVSIEGVRRATGPDHITVSFRKTLPGLQIGDRVRVNAMLFPPPGPAMPGSYDFARAFFFEGIGATGFSTKEPEILEKGAPGDWRERLDVLRHDLAARIRAPMSEENGPVAAALMVGEQSGVSEEVKDSMRDSGLYHVLSISGLHMAIAAGLLYGATRLLLSLWPAFALRVPVKKIAAAVGLAGALIYLLLAGYPVPAFRSFVMVACVMVAVLIDRVGISLYSLAWAAMLILLMQPWALLGASFQLSFAATVAILALYERYGAALYQSHADWRRRLRLYFLGLVLTSLVATLATTPLVIYHFNRFTLWGIVANMLMVPLATFWLMPAAALAFIAMPLGLEYAPLRLLDAGIGFMLDVSRFFSSMPHASFSVPSPTFWGFLLTVTGGLWLCLWTRRWRLLGLPLIVIGLCTIALHRPYDLLANDDGNKLMLRLPDGEFLFVRGRTDSFEAEVWLRAQGRDTALTLADMKDRADAPACEKNFCIIETQGARIVSGRRKGDVTGLCDKDADVVITENRLEECDAPLVIDQHFLRARGAVGLRFHEGKVEIDTAARHRGRRPWVPYNRDSQHSN